ncbi:MAG: DUF4920 domain-containing protein [Bacteroidetes bacterium]|nr:DUF4920 domain-containing protein [Bacteroidota bacterium]
MRLLLFVGLVGLTLSTSCQQDRSKQGDDQSFYGETFVWEESISVDQMKLELDKNQPLENLVVEGVIKDVCQVKGCWMTLVAADGLDVRVTFKDYGFFVPKDISGKSVVVKGVGKIVTTSVEDQRHYAEDEGQSEEEIAKITEPLTEYTFVAEGVKIK